MKQVFEKILQSPVTALTAHKSSILVGDIEGNIILFESESFASLNSVKVHKKSLRSLTVHDSSIVSASSSGNVAITDLATFSVERRLKLPEKTAVSYLHSVSPNIIALGDDDGILSFVDIRVREKEGSIRKSSLFDDYISSIISFPNFANNILVTSGDGTLCYFDYQAGKTIAKCDGLDDEIICAAKTDEFGSKVICMTATGAVNIFKFDYWGQPDDRILLEDGVSCCCKASNDSIYFSLFDGSIYEFKDHRARRLCQTDEDISCMLFDSSRLILAADNQLKIFSDACSTEDFYHNID